MYRILRKLLGRHVISHLIIPIIFGWLFEAGFEWAYERVSFNRQSIEHKADHLENVSESKPGLWARSIPFLFGVIGTYLVIAAWELERETNVQVDPADLADLQEHLKTATSYFALSSTRLNEWFEPYTQVYFSTVAGQKLRSQNFVCQRVMLFFRDAQFKDVRSDFLEGLYAKGFRDIHKNYGIPLGYLEPDTLYEILEDKDVFKSVDLVALGCIPGILKYEYGIVDWARKRWLRCRKRIKSLAGALIEKHDPDNNNQVSYVLVQFAKHHVNVELKCVPVADPDKEPYVKLIRAIRNRIVVGDQFRANNSFANAIY